MWFAGRLRHIDSHEYADSAKPILHNMADMARALNLSVLQADILLFLTVRETDERIKIALDHFSMSRYFSTRKMQSVMKIVFDVSASDMTEALNGENGLWGIGLLCPNTRHHGMELLEGIADMLHYEENALTELMDNFARQSVPPTLCREHFNHIDSMYKATMALLSAAARRNRNILIYGAPGTGKTEFVRHICLQMGLRLWEVETLDTNFNPLKPGNRLASYSLLQRILGRSNGNCILFDEVEGVFHPSFTQDYKAWINKSLESNIAPCFWLSNDISAMDPAFIRRFDLLIEMPSVPEQYKREQLNALISENTQDTLLDELCGHPALEIAHIRKSVDIVKTLPKGSTLGVVDILNSYIKANGHRPVNTKPDQDDETYDLGLINTNIDLTNLLQGLSNNHGQVCLYGPPGTGKTAFVRYLAKKLNKKLHCHQASTLLGSFVGETERNIAVAFEKAQRHNAILFIDEADSFLRKREWASQSWEVTQVNELLVQMEKFTGTLMLATNLIENLDSATMRRLPVKVKFDYLTPVQCHRMLTQLSSELDAPLRPLLSRFKFTPGDIHAVLKRLKLLCQPITYDNLLKGLEQDSDFLINRNKKPIGFIN
ncbi:AAA family ATPase [Maribrevibacterium harenarium]|uniref:AAA family ATPase n=1 Tax=Maribrevibacterium harenarium TaxID=2589817 RepID=A0A501X056_9GAMM|nr:ATP-binding protein [Maribrevibacterium harenarium]TPE51936.1 AAA family ATPase [Maribrevibacterium harenarium]